MALNDVLRLVQDKTGIAFDEEDAQMLVQADDGDAEAQADMGALFYVADQRDIAMYWLHRAAEGDSAEAMQWLASAYASAEPPDETQAMMWLSKAASRGHIIARSQMDALTSNKS